MMKEFVFLIMSNLLAWHEPVSPFLQKLYNIIFVEHPFLMWLTVVTFVSSVIVFGVSVFIMTAYKKVYPLDRATYFREIAVFLVLFRSVSGYFWDWRWPLFTATVYLMLLLGVLWYVVEILRERGLSLNWRHIKWRRASWNRLRKRERVRNDT